MDDAQLHRMATVFKALADPNRLRILGQLAARSCTGQDLAELLAVTPPTISHHMRRLVDAELVTVTPDAQSRIYALNLDAMRHLAREQRPQEGVAEEEIDSIGRAFFDGPRLKQIPASRKKRVLVLRRLLERFSPAASYTEREVNDLLRLAHDDVATLRRELVDYGFMTRDKGIYRVATELPDRGANVSQEVGDETRWFADLINQATSRAMSEAKGGKRETPASPPE